MAKLTLRTPWTSQPQVPAGIDRNNPITAGIVFASEASFGCVNIAGADRQESLGSGVTLGVGQYGKQWNFSGSQANRANSFGIFQGLTGATEATWDITVYFSGANPTAHFFGQWDFNLAWLMQASAGTLIWVAADDAAGLRDRFDLSGAFPAAGWYRITGSWKQSGHVGLLVINGAQKSPSAAGSSATSIQTPNTADYLQLGMVSGGSALNGAISGARIWRRALSLQELLSVNRNSNQVYAPLARTIWVPAAAGGTNTYTLAVSGGFSLGGTAQYNRVRNSQVSAGISFAGSSPLARTRVAQISGGVTFGGSAPITFVPFGGAVYTLAVSGGFSLGGTAPYTRTRVAQVSAGINFGGTANYSKVRISQISGGVTFGGTNSLIFIPAGGSINIPQRTIVGAGT